MTQPSPEREPLEAEREPPPKEPEGPGGELSPPPEEAPREIHAHVQPLLLRPLEAAAALTIGKRKLWELTNCGEIPHVRIGRMVRYHQDDLEEWVQQKRRDRQKRGG